MFAWSESFTHKTLVSYINTKYDPPLNKIFKKRWQSIYENRVFIAYSLIPHLRYIEIRRHLRAYYQPKEDDLKPDDTTQIYNSPRR